MYQCTHTHRTRHNRLAKHWSRLESLNRQNYIQNRIDILSCKTIQIQQRWVERRWGICKIQMNRNLANGPNTEYRRLSNSRALQFTIGEYVIIMSDFHSFSIQREEPLGADYFGSIGICASVYLWCWCSFICELRTKAISTVKCTLYSDYIFGFDRSILNCDKFECLANKVNRPEHVLSACEHRHVNIIRSPIVESKNENSTIFQNLISDAIHTQFSRFYVTFALNEKSRKIPCVETRQYSRKTK